MNLNKILAATTALTIAAVALPASAAVFVSTDKTSFDTVRKGIQTYSFPFTSDTKLGSSYTVDKVTFAASDMYGLNDCSTGNTPLLAEFSGDLTVAYAGPVLALTLESGYAQTLNYTVNGVAETIKLAAFTPTFLGFDTGSANSSLKVVFDGSCSSALGVLGFQTAVPEAATWAMMMVGLGVVGGSLRRRRTTAPRVRFA